MLPDDKGTVLVAGNELMTIEAPTDGGDRGLVRLDDMGSLLYD